MYSEHQPEERHNRDSMSQMRFGKWIAGICWGVVFFLAASLVVFGDVSVAVSQEESHANDTSYLFGPGDVLDVFVFGEPEVSVTVNVRIDGRISVPLAGEFKAAGVSPEELTGQIRTKLEQFIESPDVTVMLVESRSRSYYVLGQVESPGEYRLIQPITVLQAIARAGGFLEWANKRNIMVVSGPGRDDAILFFNYNDFLKNADSQQNIVIQSGDTIVIP